MNRDNLSDVYNLDHSHIWSPLTTNGIYNLDIGTNGVYKQTDIEKVVISRIQNEPLAYRHTSSLPTPDMYVIPSPVTYRASHHPPPQCEIISFRINEFFSSFHDTPKRNASLHSKRPEVVSRAVPPPCSLTPKGDREHAAGVLGNAIMSIMSLMTRQTRPQAQRLLREKDETWHLHPETVRRATNTAATMLNAGTGVLREKDNTLHLHPVTVRRTANAAAKTYAMCSRVCLFDDGKLPGARARTMRTWPSTPGCRASAGAIAGAGAKIAAAANFSSFTQSLAIAWRPIDLFMATDVLFMHSSRGKRARTMRTWPSSPGCRASDATIAGAKFAAAANFSPLSQFLAIAWRPMFCSCSPPDGCSSSQWQGPPAGEMEQIRGVQGTSSTGKNTLHGSPEQGKQ